MKTTGDLQPQITSTAIPQPPRLIKSDSDPVSLAERRAAQNTSIELPIRSLPVWGLPDVAAALVAHEVGQFNLSALLSDALMQDPAIKAAVETRVRALSGLPFRFEPADRSRKALMIADQAKEQWDSWVAPEEAEVFRRWRLLMGVGIGQLLWDTSGKQWTPHFNLWNPTNLYWYWDWTKNFGRWQLITASGVIEPIGGDGQWVFAKAVEKRPQMEGLVRTLSVRFVGRNYALQGWGRYNEVHGLPIMKAIMPAEGDENHIKQYKGQFANLGSQQVFALRQGVEGNKFDLELEEAMANTFETFQKFLADQRTELTIAILGQNLTTEVKGGSRAAAQVHNKVRLDLTESDARAEQRLFHRQILLPWTTLNFGDPRLAPRLIYDVSPPEDLKSKADRISVIFTGIAALAKNGPSVLGMVDMPKLLADNGIPLVAALADKATLDRSNFNDDPSDDSEMRVKMMRGLGKFSAIDIDDLVDRNGRSKRRTHVSTVAVFNPEGRMLFGVRCDDGSYSEPGGHAEPDEDPAACALRELKEETGLTPLTFEPLGAGLAGEDGDIHVTAYRATVDGDPTGENDPDHEFEGFVWVDVKNGLPDAIREKLRHKTDVALDALEIPYRREMQK